MQALQVAPSPPRPLCQVCWELVSSTPCRAPSHECI